MKEKPLTKAERREKRKRPRMPMRGLSLRRPSKYAGLKLANKKSR